MRMRTLSIFAVGLLVLVAMGACGSSSATSTPAAPAPTTAAAAKVAAASATPVPMDPTATAASAGSTGTEPAEIQNESGQEVYSQKCTECHGTNLQGTGAGPELTAPNLLSFANAQKLLTFISNRMPLNAPGSLSQQQDLDVTAYILHHASLLPLGQALTSGNAASIPLQQVMVSPTPGPSPTPGAAPTPTAVPTILEVQVAQVPGLGAFLTTAKGYTLYYYDKDQPGQSNCTGSCAQTFQPLTAGEGVNPGLGAGIPGTLTTVERPDGNDQVAYSAEPAYDQIPLYTYYGDSEPGETKGNYYENAWHIVSVEISEPLPTATSLPVAEAIAQGNAGVGAALYMGNCTQCHGLQGQGVDAPPLRDSQYVQSAGDQAVFDTVANGRANTEMPSWLADNGGPFDAAQVGDVVAYLHTLQDVSPLPTQMAPPEEPTATPVPAGAPTPEPARPSMPGQAGLAVTLTGDAGRGAIEFGHYCARCHGPEGVQGIPNPGSDDGSVPPLNPIDPTIYNSDPKIFATNVDLFIEHGSIPEGPNPQILMPRFGDGNMLTPETIADIIAYVLSINGAQ
jgi:mono/diheme cytochrome c family protein